MLFRLLQGFLLMFRSYFEGLKDPTALTPLQVTMDETSAYSQIVSGSKDKVSRKYDDIFVRHAERLPLPFLRALAKRESNLNPNDMGGSFWGILQVGWRGKHAVLKGYNKRYESAYTKEGLLNPSINTMIAAELINRIANNYRKLAKESPRMMENMIPDFENKEFVKLLLAGWNSGYSKAGGVQRVARYLARKGVPVTHDAVFAHAADAGATRFLRASVPGEAGEHARIKQRWQRGVASLFFRMDDYTPNPPDKGLLIVREDSEGKPGPRPDGINASAALAVPLLLGLGTVALLTAK